MSQIISEVFIIACCWYPVMVISLKFLSDNSNICVCSVVCWLSLLILVEIFFLFFGIMSTFIMGCILDILSIVRGQLLIKFPIILDGHCGRTKGTASLLTLTLYRARPWWEWGGPAPWLSLVRGKDVRQSSVLPITQHLGGKVPCCQAAVFSFFWLETLDFLGVFLCLLIYICWFQVANCCSNRVRFRGGKKFSWNSLLGDYSRYDISNQFVSFFFTFQNLLVVAVFLCSKIYSWNQQED